MWKSQKQKMLEYVSKLPQSQKDILQFDNSQFAKNEAKVMKIKTVLEKPVEQRTESDLDQVTDLLKKEKFFKQQERKDLTYHEIREISSQLTFQRAIPLSKIIEYGEKANHFYIIIKGVVTVRIPNPEIQDWSFKRRDYLNLLKWKKDILDPRIEIAKSQH